MARKEYLPIGTLVEIKPEYDRANIIKSHGKLWLVRSREGNGRQLYRLSSLATGKTMTTHPDNFVTCVDEEAAA